MEVKKKTLVVVCGTTITLSVCRVYGTGMSSSGHESTVCFNATNLNFSCDVSLFKLKFKQHFSMLDFVVRVFIFITTTIHL